MMRFDDNRRSHPQQFQPRAATLRGWLLAWMVLLLIGCAPPPSSLKTEYGTRRGDGRASVNGTTILGTMFERAGFEVSSWRRLSPRLQYDDVIVWAPDSFAVPSDAEIDYLEDWLADQEGRTLVYIGRDYDAALDYWQSVLESEPSDPIAVRRELARATTRHMANRGIDDEESRKCRWFRWSVDESPLLVRAPQGPWAQAVQADQAQGSESSEEAPPAERDDSAGNPTAANDVEQSFHARLRSRLLLPEESADEIDWRGPLESKYCLLGEGQPLAIRLQRPAWGSSQLIVVANGSWLLNLPLVREGNRQLAGQLIRECGEGARVCFLESDNGGLTITNSDAQLPLMLQSFTVWPINLLVLHLLLLGLIYCFSIYPIFGAPRPLREDRVSDFGKHIEAVGALIERNRDAAFADQQLRQYRDAIGNTASSPASRDPGTK